MQDLKLSAQSIAEYKERGFLRVPSVLTEKEVAAFKNLALKNRDVAMAEQRDFRDGALHRVVNAWQTDPAFKAITFHPRLCSLAMQLAGCELRLWHDQVMIKPSGNAATAMHQGQPNWSHQCFEKSNAITAWIALVDVPLEAGCMGYIPGTQKLWNLGQQMGHYDSFFDLAPALQFTPVEFVPLKAGDIAFHHGNTVHCAAPNQIGHDRIAATVNFMDVHTQYRTTPHAVTDGMGYVDGDILDNEAYFPLLSQILAQMQGNEQMQLV